MTAQKLLMCLTFFVAVTLVACSKVEFDKGAPAGTASVNPVVCDPFGNGGGSNSTQGLVADLHFLEDDDRAGRGAPDRFQYYIDWAKPQNHLLKYVFLNQLNVRSRAFTNGFQNQGGAYVKKTDGTKMEEYFALDLQSELSLAGKPAGAYQLAVISDDGAIVDITDTNNTIQVINQDGYNSSRLGCAISPVVFNSTEKKPIRIRYFQSPRTHIALMLLWRPWQGGSSSDPLCGKQGGDFGQDSNNFFFDTNADSAPTSNFTVLTSRNWEVVAPQHFSLPSGTTNPCVQ